MKYAIVTQGGLQRDIELNLSEILPVYLADRLYLSVAVKQGL